MNEAEQISKALEALLEDADFQELAEKFRQQTIFDVLAVAWDERKHSAVLGWFLSPDQAHGMGSDFIRRFLVEAAKQARDNHIVSYDYGTVITPLEAETFLYRDIAVRLELTLPNGRRPDIVLSSESDDFLCIIENKLGAGELPSQTDDYYEQSKANESGLQNYKRRLFIYLTPSGQRPTSKHFVPMEYQSILEIGKAISSRLTPLGKTILDHYLACVENKVMKQDQLHELCLKLYKKHKQAIDKIHEYTSSVLLTRVFEKSKKHLDDAKNPKIPSGWHSNVSRGKLIWFAFHLKKWGGRNNYSAYYGGWANENSEDDSISIGVAFFGQDGKRVFEQYEKLAKDAGKDLGSVEKKDWYIAAHKINVVNAGNYDQATDRGVKELELLIEDTYEMVQQALDKTFGTNANEGVQAS